MYTEQTNTSVLFIVGPKCTLTVSHTAPGESRYADVTDRRTDGWTPDRYITLSARRGQRYKPDDNDEHING